MTRRHTRAAALSAVLGFSLVVLANASTARADFITHPLVGASGALLSGSQNFLANSNGLTLNVTIDYAVWSPSMYANPGNFQAFGNSPNPTLSGSDYVYAYQIYNNGVLSGVPNPSSPTEDFHIMSVDFFGTITAIGEDFAFDSSTNDIGGTLSVLNNNGASYWFVLPPISPDQFSAVMILGSPDAPAFANASIKDGGLSTGGMLPTPVPVPSAALLGLVGLSLICWARRLA